MPELPEVECLVRAIRPLAEGAELVDATFFRRDLRYEIPIKNFKKLLVDQSILSVTRRSKFMLWESEKGFGIFHLGMSGNILCYDTPKPQLNHTHAVFTVRKKDKTHYLHFVDPRRFGLIDCIGADALKDYKFFKKLGPEPLTTQNLGDYLYQKSRDKKVSVKVFLMNAEILVGVGNIYASESLFRARINPLTPAEKVTRPQFNTIADSIRDTLKAAIKAGGTTFRDFKNPDGNPGYFKLKLNVYDREGEACNDCDTTIAHVKLGGRATYYCPRCQKVRNAAKAAR